MGLSVWYLLLLGLLEDENCLKKQTGMVQYPHWGYFEIAKDSSGAVTQETHQEINGSLVIFTVPFCPHPPMPTLGHSNKTVLQAGHLLDNQETRTWSQLNGWPVSVPGLLTWALGTTLSIVCIGEVAWITSEIHLSSLLGRTRNGWAKCANECAFDVTVPWHVWAVSDQGGTGIIQVLMNPTHQGGTQVKSGGALPSGPAVTTLPAHMASFCRKGKMRERTCVGSAPKDSFTFPHSFLSLCLADTSSPPTCMLILYICCCQKLIIELQTWNKVSSMACKLPQ